MNAKEILQSAIKSAKEQIKSISAELEAPVLDGTPWMLCQVDETGINRIYGHWPDGMGGSQKGWLAESALQNHACGAVMVDTKKADRFLANHGHKVNMSKMHVREFKSKRVAELQALIKSLENL